MVSASDQPVPSSTRRNYQRVGRLYEWMANDEARRLPPWKADQVAAMQGDERVLYAGAGPGFDAMAAASKGCDVTCIDIASNMLARAEQRFKAAGLVGRFVADDLLEHTDAAGYDIVVANFFMNIFEPSLMIRMLDQLIALTRQGGRLMIADFIPAVGWGPSSLWARFNYRFAIGFFGLFRLSPWQPMHDYLPPLIERNIQIASVHDYPGMPLLPAGYRGIVTIK